MNVHIAYNLQPLFHKKQLVSDCTANSSNCLKKILGFLENFRESFRENSSAFICTNSPSSWEFSGLHWNRNGLKILGNSWEWNGFLFDSGILGNSGEQEHFKGRYSKKKNKFPGIFRGFKEWSEFNSNYINNQNSQIWLAINCTDFSLNRTLRVMSK